MKIWIGLVLKTFEKEYFHCLVSKLDRAILLISYTQIFAPWYDLAHIIYQGRNIERWLDEFQSNGFFNLVKKNQSTGYCHSNKDSIVKFCFHNFIDSGQGAVTCLWKFFRKFLNRFAIIIVTDLMVYCFNLESHPNKPVSINTPNSEWVSQTNILFACWIYAFIISFVNSRLSLTCFSTFFYSTMTSLMFVLISELALDKPMAVW